MEKSFSDIIKYLSAFAIISGAFGLIIINLYLQKYNLVDFNVIQPQIIYVGFIFILILMFNFLFFFMLLDLENPSKNSLLKITLLTFSKLAILGNTLNYLLNTDEINKVFIGQNNSLFTRFFLNGAIIGGTIIYILVFVSYEWIIKDDKRTSTKIIYIYPLIFFTLWSIAGAIYCYFNVPLAKNFYSFELYIAFLFYMFFIGIWAKSNDKERGLNTTPVSMFGTDATGFKSLDKWFVVVYLIVMMLILITKYSSQIYPYISPYYGGGKPQIVRIVVEGDTLKGELISQNSSYLFIKKDSTLVKLDWSRIKSILLTDKDEKIRQLKEVVKHINDSLQFKDK